MTNPSQLQVLAARRVPEAPPHPAPPRRRRFKRRGDGELAIRVARRSDSAGVAQLEALEGRRLSCGERLVAYLDGRLVAALALADDVFVADPFEPSGGAVELLRMRARQVRTATAAPRAPRLTLLERLAAR